MCDLRNSCVFPVAIQNIKYKRTTILGLVLYGYGTWSLTIGQGRNIDHTEMFEKRVVRAILRPKRKAAKVGEFHILYSSQTVIYQ
jgi:hypothetical protein